MDEITVTILKMTPEEKDLFLDWIAIRGLDVQSALEKVGVTCRSYDFTKETDKGFDADVSKAIRSRKPVSRRRLAQFDTFEDRKLTQLKLRDQSRIDDKLNQFLMACDPTDPKNFTVWAKVMHARWSTQDRNIHQNTTIKFEDAQTMGAEVGDLLKIMEKCNATIEELTRNKAIVARKRAEALGQPVSEEFQALLDQEKPADV